MGKHVRPSKTAVVTGTATAGMMLAGAAVGVVPASAASLPVSPAVAAGTPAATPAVPQARAAVPHYRVKGGDTLSGIAQRFCHSPAKWRQLWQGNRALIKNPDLIYPGQLVRLVCAALASLAAPPSTPPDPVGGPTGSPAATPAATPALTVTVTGAQGVLGGRALRAIRNLVRERIDEGQDFSGTGALYPVAPGTVENVWARPGSGWEPAYILEKLDAPVDGHGWVYYAEDIRPSVTVPEHVSDATVLGQVYHGGTGIEIGFGTSQPDVAAAYGRYTDGVPTAEGRQMAALLSENPPPRARPRHKAIPVAGRHQNGLSNILSRMGYDGESMAALAGYLRAHGYSPAGAAGVVGCVAGESGGNPESVGMGGGGIIGWTPLPPGLVTGDRARDLQVQAARLIAYDRANGNVAALNAQPTASAAAWYYSAQFERPLRTGSDIRHEVADAVFAALAG